MTLYGNRGGDRTAKGQAITIWSGSFISTWEASGHARDGAKQITLSTYNQDKVIVRLPEGVTFPRTGDNYVDIDKAINDALNAYEQARGSVQMMPDIPVDSPPLDDIPDPRTPGADDV